PAQLKGALEHFASKAAMNIEGLGKKTVAQLVDRGLVRDLADLYDLKREHILKLDGFADRSATLLLEAIERSKHVPLDRFLYALGIRQVGRHIASLLAKEFGSLQAIMQADTARLQAIKEIGPEISASLVSYFQEPSNRRVLDRLLQAGILIEQTALPQKKAAHPLAGKNFVFTGGLETLSREDASSLVEQLGGTVSSTVSAKTSFVVVGANPGSKLAQAKKLGIPLLTEQEFLKLVEHPPSSY
ncbi:MAG: helix-hairpin-helix domain-containing protein, partial [Nitrospira sp.]